MPVKAANSRKRKAAASKKATDKRDTNASANDRPSKRRRLNSHSSAAETPINHSPKDSSPRRSARSHKQPSQWWKATDGTNRDSRRNDSRRGAKSKKQKKSSNVSKKRDSNIVSDTDTDNSATDDNERQPKSKRSRNGKSARNKSSEKTTAVARRGRGRQRKTSSNRSHSTTNANNSSLRDIKATPLPSEHKQIKSSRNRKARSQSNEKDRRRGRDKPPKSEKLEQTGETYDDDNDDNNRSDDESSVESHSQSEIDTTPPPRKNRVSRASAAAAAAVSSSTHHHENDSNVSNGAELFSSPHNPHPISKLPSRIALSDGDNDLSQRWQDMLQESNSLTVTLQKLSPFIQNNAVVRKNKEENYAKLYKQYGSMYRQYCDKLSEFDSVLTDIESRASNHDDKLQSKLTKLKLQIETTQQMAATPDPVLAQENQKLKAKLQAGNTSKLMMQEQFDEMEKRVRAAQDEMTKQSNEFETKLSMMEDDRSREIERLEAQHKINLNRLEMDTRSKQQELDENKSETERRMREQETKAALVIGQLERENEALTEQLQQLLKDANTGNIEAVRSTARRLSTFSDISVGAPSLSVSRTDTPNSAMASPAYDPNAENNSTQSMIISAVRRMRAKRASIAKSPLSEKAQTQLNLQSDMDELQKEVEKYKMEMEAYQRQMGEKKDQNTALETQLQQSQLDRKLALDEREKLLQTIGVYQTLSGTRIEFLSTSTREVGSAKATDSANTPEMADKSEVEEQKDEDMSESSQVNAQSRNAASTIISGESEDVTLQKEVFISRFLCKTLNKERSTMLEFMLSTNTNFVDYNLLRAHNIDKLPLFLSSELCVQPLQAPLFTKALLEAIFSDECIASAVSAGMSATASVEAGRQMFTPQPVPPTVGMPLKNRSRLQNQAASTAQ